MDILADIRHCEATAKVLAGCLNTAKPGSHAWKVTNAAMQRNLRIADNLKKQIEVANQIEEWANKQGHDRCWYYPDIFAIIVKVLGINVSSTPTLPSPDEFKVGCALYHKEQYPNVEN